MTKNAYIHIPFCKSKCKYCSFVSFPQLELKEKFLDALKKEIKHFYKGEKLNTLYFGGGTPSVLSSKDFEDLITLFKFEEDAEITTELNPETLTFEYLKALKEIGINRISLGCQTFDNKILKLIGRRHSSKAVENAIIKAKEAGFKNISIDFIYGLPEQTIESFSEDLLHGISLGVQHISLYGLKIEEGCNFYKCPPKNLPDDDLQADMYLKAIDIMKENNFEHYEISNFSLAGYNSRHNLNYWDNNSYYGFGVAAHGYVDEKRYSNTNYINTYTNNPIEQEFENILTQQEKLEEEIFLGFRKMSGINVNEINLKYGINFLETYSIQLRKFLDTKYLLETNVGYKLSDSGILLSNLILSEFI